MRERQALKMAACVLLGCLWLSAGAGAQSAVSDDEVNAVAARLYCPICENIPLEDCGTPTCRQWKERIRAELASGMSFEQIRDGFIADFGERVVGTPQNPTLRALSVVTPFVLAAVAAVVALVTLLRVRRVPDVPGRAADAGAADETGSRDSYRDQLERDVRA